MSIIWLAVFNIETDADADSAEPFMLNVLQFGFSMLGSASSSVTLTTYLLYGALWVWLWLVSCSVPSLSYFMITAGAGIGLTGCTGGSSCMLKCDTCV